MGYREILESFYPGARLERLGKAQLGGAADRTRERVSRERTEGEAKMATSETRMANRPGDPR
jgi:hypothetical protein